MASKQELDIREVQRSGSPLRNHSLNQHNMKDQRDGDVRAHGMEFGVRQRQGRRVQARIQTRQDVYDSLSRLFAGNGTEADALVVFTLIGDLEDNSEPIVSAKEDTLYHVSTVDFTEMRTTSEKTGEPAIFRK